MSETPEVRGPATPRHLWVVGVIALLWNAVGAMDYVMTQTQNEAYMSSFTPDRIDLRGPFRPPRSSRRSALGPRHAFPPRLQPQEESAPALLEKAPG